ncbi:MAG: toll/interleukin-1 receptor domain-containing protein [Rhodomicrobium sp.]
MPGRIFISYSKADPGPTRELADFLTAQGYSVWWDRNLTSGEVFREVIDRELAAADAVIVIWTAHSVASNWVVSEADDAARRGKLITVRTGDLEPWRIPKPYNTYQADVADNRDAVLAAVRRLTGEPPKPELKRSTSLSEAALHEALALEHWQSIKTNADPAMLRSFLAEFGDSKCAPLAGAELQRLTVPKRFCYSNNPFLFWSMFLVWIETFALLAIIASKVAGIRSDQNMGPTILAVVAIGWVVALPLIYRFFRWLSYFI